MGESSLCTSKENEKEGAGIKIEGAGKENEGCKCVRGRLRAFKASNNRKKGKFRDPI